jgi:hypothetical protein
MNWQDFETLSHLEFKSKLIEHFTERVKQTKLMEQSTEYEYCEVQGRIKELEELQNFIETFKRPAL